MQTGPDIPLPPDRDPVACARWLQLPRALSPWLHEEVGARMQERLDWIRTPVASWLSWWPSLGGLQAHQRVAQRFPRAACRVLEPTSAQTQATLALLKRPWWALRGPATPQPAQPGQSVDLLWANMGLHAVVDPGALLRQWHQALNVGGFVLFSTLGPDSFQELRALHEDRGWPAPTVPWTDMHDWGDMLVASGFAEPVMDVERIALTYEAPQRLLADLRAVGRNVHRARFAGLRGRGWQQQWLRAWANRPLRLTVEVVYGHAYKPQPRARVQAETRIDLAQMRQSLSRRSTS